MTEIEASDLSRYVECDFALGTVFFKPRVPEDFGNTKEAKRLACAWNARHAGKECFTSNHSEGYKFGRLFGFNLRAHRVVWALAYGEWPKGEIDHINGIRTDNRLCNLRDVSSSENKKNMKRRIDNKSGVSGVLFVPSRQRFHVSIRVNKKTVFVGSFLRKEDAIAARKAAEARHGYHPNFGRIA